MPSEQPSELDRLRATVTELSILNEIAASINASMSVDRITESILDRSLRYLGANQGAVFLLDMQNNPTGSFRTFIRRSAQSPEELPLHFNMSLTGWMVNHKKLLVVNSPDDAAELNRLDLEALGIETLLAAPLLSRSGLIGVLAVCNTRREGGFNNSDARFLGILGTQCAQVIESARLYAEEKQLVALREELQVARSIQQNFLPDLSAFSQLDFIHAVTEPAREVGGDFFDIVDLGEKGVFWSVGDVAGKGIPAALLMVNALTVERSHLGRSGPLRLEALAEDINRLLCQFNRAGQFITAVFGLYHPGARRLEYVNAGHHPPVVLDRSGTHPPEGLAGLVLGVLPEEQYHVESLAVPPDALVCAYTDGVTEAFDANGEQFGPDRLLCALRDCCGDNSRTVCRRVVDEVKVFCGDCDQSDDITLLAIRS